MQLSDVAEMAAKLEGVHQTAKGDLARWSYHGRLVARQLDAENIVIRADFDYRDALVQDHPTTFSVPDRFAKHMMVAASLATADPGAIEDALVAAWELQQSAD